MLEEVDYCIEKVSAAVEKLSTGNECPFVPLAEVPWPYATSPEDLIGKYQDALEDLDIGAYGYLLHPEFIMILQESTIRDFPTVGATLDRAQEIGIHQRMFAGDSGVDENGEITPPVSSFSMQVPTQLTGWEDSESDAVIPDTPKALFEVSMEYLRAVDKSLVVEGMVELYVVERDSVVDGQTLTIFQLRGMHDLTNDQLVSKPMDSTSLGAVKCLWR